MIEDLKPGLDMALIIIMGYFLLRGIFRGVVKEIVAVLGVFVAFWVASLYWPMGDEHLKPIFDLPSHRGMVSFTMIFVVVYFLIGVISIFVDKIVKITISPIVSALLGALVGAGKGILVCAVLLAGAGAFIKPTDEFFTESKLWPHLAPVTQQAKAWLPEALKLAMEAKRMLPPVSSRYQPKNDSGGDISTPPNVKMEIDWPAVKNLLATKPGEIIPAWRDKIRSVPSGQALSEEDIKKFMADHPNLFNPAPGAPAGTTAEEAPGASPPNWPQPAE